eukprot:14148672-Alexandrium_andersonii.AAC.1
MNSGAEWASRELRGPSLNRFWPPCHHHHDSKHHGMMAITADYHHHTQHAHMAPNFRPVS